MSEPVVVKPFDTNVLAEKLKARGLDVAEDAATIIVEETAAWIKESVILTEGKLDDLAAPILDAIMPVIKKELDKIDGKEG